MRLLFNTALFDEVKRDKSGKLPIHQVMACEFNFENIIFVLSGLAWLAARWDSSLVSQSSVSSRFSTLAPSFSLNPGSQPGSRYESENVSAT